VRELAEYFDVLASSHLTFGWKGVAFAFLILFVSSHVLHRRALSLYNAQPHVSGDNLTEIEKRWGWVLPANQFIFGVAIILVAVYCEEPLFTLLAGGLLVTSIFAVSTNLRTIFHYRSLALPGAVQGSIQLSHYSLLRTRAIAYFAAAFFCLLTGLVLPHLALLGGAFILGSTGIGFLRRARRESHL
jgi:hypothetical protein